MQHDQPRLHLEIDHRMVGWCEKAAVETFNSIFGSEIKLRDVEIELDPLRGQEVSGVISFAQASLEGVLCLSFPQSTLASMATKFYQKPSDQIGEELLIGAVSEITSILFGLIKEQYNQRGFLFQPAFPIVVMGPPHEIFSTFPTNKLHLRFDSLHGEFTLEISAAQGR
jgi:CheY-specific phosphatase CheX